jgi:hypothetical protein
MNVLLEENVLSSGERKEERPLLSIALTNKNIYPFKETLRF